MSKIIFAGVCRNIEKNIAVLQGFISALKKQIPDYTFFIYENNSSDATPALLHTMATEGLIKLCSETVSDTELRAADARFPETAQISRMERIAFARNRLCNFIEAAGGDYDYLVLLDLDMEVHFDPAIIIATIARNQEKPWGAIICNGVLSNGQMYDSYAYRDAQYCLGPELLADYWWHRAPFKLFFSPRKQRLHEIFSGFNGCAIYRRAAIEGLRYSAAPTPILDDYHRYCITNFPRNKFVRAYKKFLHSVQQSPETVFYVHNSGYNFPVVCEHLNFHLEIRTRGHKIYLDPQFVIPHSAAPIGLRGRLAALWHSTWQNLLR